MPPCRNCQHCIGVHLPGVLDRDAKRMLQEKQRPSRHRAGGATGDDRV
jgi:hypothetical protein